MLHAVEARSAWLARHILPHEPELRRWLARSSDIGGDQIDDLVQESYAILVGRTEVDSIRDPRSYLFQVARSVLLQQLRRSRVVALGALDDLDRLGAATDMPSPEHQTLARDEFARVAAAIAAMPPQTRRAFQMRRVEGLSQREIAGALGLSENTVEKHIARGIRALMKQFGRRDQRVAPAPIAAPEHAPRRAKAS
ncbi:RNA polymerase sigma factor [Novosphingobium sp. 9]|uniref:RNA polymerase sigma factor n=1 Tax=Novosphingobium sp. 9 TaxID=2025349 RepID=UPI0021B56A20|nr:RNA polymerase sigma factor [Novosphingobium sp. 9]